MKNSKILESITGSLVEGLIGAEEKCFEEIKEKIGALCEECYTLKQQDPTTDQTPNQTIHNTFN